MKISTFLARPEDIPVAGAVLAKHLGLARPASTTVIVPALVDPGWLIEIEAVAAAND